MSSEILSVLEYMEKEKGIGRADMIAAIVNAIKSAIDYTLLATFDFSFSTIIATVESTDW